MSLSTTQSSPSRIARRTRGQTHGLVTRLMSPSDFGQLLKPFVFLDLFDNHGKPFSGFGLHPHSGIATLTYVMEGNVGYEDTNGATGLLPAGGIEWMRAGAGVWHGGELASRDGRGAFSFGSLCRPCWSWGYRRASTKRRKLFAAMGRRGCCSAVTTPRPVRSKLHRRSIISW